MSESFNIEIEYGLRSEPRYGYGKPPHAKLYEIINRNRVIYEKTLKDLFPLVPEFRTIPLDPDPTTETGPFWRNGFLPGLDAVSLYSFLCRNRPRLYIEIGSGNSTKFAAHAIRKHRLPTTIVSIDPSPRAEIDGLADFAVRKPFEEIDVGIMDELRAGDILFMDGSHRCFMNSDATVFFLDVLPRLSPGVIVQIHDICLPDDYYPGWADRYYSEQYLLACYLLAGASRFEVISPNHFIWNDEKLRNIVQNIWNEVGIEGIEPHGGSFWIRMK